MNINDLYALIDDSHDVLFIRNGQYHSAGKTTKHFKNKYKHFLAAGHIEPMVGVTDFIYSICGLSTYSKEAYEVLLPDGTVKPCNEWLFERAQQWREDNE